MIDTLSFYAGGSLTPTGTVSFYEGGTLLATATLNSQETMMFEGDFTTSALSLGSHTITGTYSGDVNFIGGSASFTVTVNS